MLAKRLILKALFVTMLISVGGSSAFALTLQLTNNSNTPVGTLMTAEHLVRTTDSITVTVIAENTPWDDNNWLGWTHPGLRELKSIIRPTLAAGAVRSSAPPNPFGLTLLNDINLGAGLVDSLYTTPNDAQLFSEDTLSRPSPNNTYQWFQMYDVSSLGFQNYRWHDGDGQVNSFSGDYDILIFVDDDHTAPNFDYDDFMAGIGNARPATACDFTTAPTLAFGADYGLSQCTPAQICASYSTTGSGTESLVSGPPGATINTSTNVVCFTPAASGVYTLIAKTTDGCGRENRDTINVTVTLNGPPVLAFGADYSVTQCTPTSICAPYTVTDPDGLTGHVESIVSAPPGATINTTTNEVCFTPAASGLYTIIAKVVDPCSFEDRDTIKITVTLNSPPVLAFGADYSVSQCSPTQICAPYTVTDPDGLTGHIESLVSGPAGAAINTSTNEVCFTPAAGGVFTIIAKVVDPCGAEDRDTISVTVTLNSPPVVAFGADFSVGQCAPAQICAPYTVSDPNGLAGVVEALIVCPPATTFDTAGNQVCFTPAGAGVYTYIIEVTDPCGAKDRDTINITVTVNNPPTIAFGADFSANQCSPAQICAPYTASDPDGAAGLIESLISGPSGTTIDTAANQVCFTPAASGTYTLIAKLTDACGAFDKDTVVVTVTITPAPVATCPGNSSQTVCNLSQVVPVPGFSFANGAATVIGGTLNAGSVTLTSPVAGPNVIKLIVTNACGADTCEATVNITVSPAPVAACPGNSTQTVCDLSQVAPIPGFSFANGTPTVIGGTLNAGSVTLTTPVAGPNVIKLIVTNACGADTCEATVSITVTPDPVVTCPGNSSQTVCNLSQVAPVPGFSFANGTATVIGGTLNAGSVTITNPVAGANVIKLICTNACGADTCETTVDITVSPAPVANCPGNSSQTVCNLSQVVPVPGFSFANGTATVIGGTLNAGSVTITNPVAGANVIKLIVTNACGADTCEATVNITVTPAPVATCPGNSSQTVCNLSQVALVPGFSFANGTATVIGGTLNAGSVTITNPVAGANLIKLICTNACGADTCEATVTITLSPAPVATCPGNSSQSVCNLGQVVPVSGFSFANGTATVIGGTLNAGSVTLTNPVAGNNVIKLIVTNACGADTCEATVNITLTPDPVAMCPGNSSQTVCALSDVTPVPGFSFANGNATVIGGTVNAGSVTITNPVAGANVIKLICTNPCGADTCQTTVTVNVQSQPICPDVADTTRVRICDIYEYCLDLGTPSIGENGFACAVISGPGTVTGSQWCYTPQSLEQTVTVTVECTDDCNHVCQSTFTVVFYTDPSCDECPQICIDTLTAAPNSTASVCIRVEEGGIPWGGFDFLFDFDPSMLTFLGAEPGQFLIDCDWEYFTYRILSAPGKIRVVAIADMNNSNDHPLCLSPGPGDIIACLTFRVTGDWTLSCRDALIQWYWADCSDNSISNPLGDVLYIASSAPGSVGTWEHVDLTGQPGVGGPPLPCPSDKSVPQECTRFCGGKIKIICPGDIDARGDLNLNSVSYEIADAVLYSRYFISGPGVFGVNALGQIAASDVNADGTPLTVADLVYLIRVITGDELPITDDLLSGGPKVAATVGSVAISTEHRGVNTSVAAQSEFDLGAALFVFNTHGAAIQSVDQTSRSRGMDLGYEVQGDQLRVLLYSIEDKARIPVGSGELLSITTVQDAELELIQVEAATFAGGALTAELTAKMLPSQFTLHANHPNPFNPSTSFNVDFPTATDYSVVIYNIAGQAVRTYAGSAQAGTSTFHWDGRSESGVSVASGVYFYQISAGPYSEVRKMVLMK